MQSGYRFDAEDRLHGPPMNPPERALDYNIHRQAAAAAARQADRPSRLCEPRRRSSVMTFVTVETPQPSFLVDSVDPRPCPVRRK
ncbi:hypothetical protein NESM_000288300 [Novymonas esmeraldas]|uniref:Uncharacterized protein n=1 Tax=Novymonas esmeraldas TaxID=1808958 RepID=A0AAW0F7I9_9TRYP